MPKINQPTIGAPRAILTFSSIFEPVSGPDNGSEKKYQAVLVFPEGTDFTGIKAAVVKAAKDEFGENIDLKKLNLPFRDAGEKAEDWGEPFRKGRLFIRAASDTKHKPLVVGVRKGDEVTPDTVFSGCTVRAAIQPAAYEYMGKKGVNFRLVAVKLVQTGERLGGGGAASAKKLFAELEPESDIEYDPTGDLTAAPSGQGAVTATESGSEDDILPF